MQQAGFARSNHLLHMVFITGVALIGLFIGMYLDQTEHASAHVSTQTTPRVTSFTLIDADRDEDLAIPLTDGQMINLAALPTNNLNLRANTEPTEIGSVRFALDGDTNFRTENGAPYALAGDDGQDDYYAIELTVGDHTLTATPYTDANGTGTAGTALTISFMVINDESALQPTPTRTATPIDTHFTALVFSKTAGYRHPSISAGQSAISDLAAAEHFTARFSEESSDFNDDTLATIDVVIFLSTTGDIFNSDEQAAFERFIQGGGGFVGIHAASDTEYDWPWYGGLIGTYFDSHPEIQLADVLVVDADHASTVALPDVWQRRDEWYNFQSQPSGVNVLLRVDEESYSGGTMGANHPVAWYHNYDGGRSWYTAMGHTSASFRESLFLEHLRGGILWAAGETGMPTPTPTPTVLSTVTATVTPTVTPTHTPMPTHTPTPFAVTGFTLVNAETNEDIRPLTDGETLDLGALPTAFNIRAHTTPNRVNSVRFALNDNPYYRVEHIAPYAIGGDSRGDYHGWSLAVGKHTLVAEPYPELMLQGDPGDALTLTLTVIDSSTVAIKSRAGSVSQRMSGTNAVSATASLNGVLYIDENRNGLSDAGEAALAGITVTVTALENHRLAELDAANVTVVTEADGRFSISGLAAEHYRLAPDLPLTTTALNERAGEIILFQDSEVEVPDFIVFSNEDIKTIHLPVVIR